jgi:hypothetical protein
MKAKIASEPTGRYQRHTSLDAETNKELTKITAQKTSRVVAGSQQSRKRKSNRDLMLTLCCTTAKPIDVPIPGMCVMAVALLYKNGTGEVNVTLKKTAFYVLLVK